MELIRALSWLALILGSYYIAIGILFCFPKNRAYTLGKLEKTKGAKNVHIRAVGSKYRTVVVPHWTNFTYSYTVNGKTYKTSGSVANSPKQLPYRPSIVYIKRMPRYAFVRGLTMFQRPIWGFALIVVSILFLIIT